VQVDLHPNYKAIAADIADADFVTKATSVVSAGWRIAQVGENLCASPNHDKAGITRKATPKSWLDQFYCR
jgi:hypothetical protein